MRSAAAILMSCLSLSSVHAQSQRAVLVRTDRAAADSSWSAGFRSTLPSIASADLTLLWPGAPVVQGLPNATRLLMVDSTRVTWQPIGADLAADSTLGATWGVSVASAGTGAPVIGRYLATWRREQDWKWRLAAMMFTELTPDGSAPPAAGLPLELPPLAASGSTAPFTSADLGFARLASDSGAAIAFERWAAPDAHMYAGGGMLVEGPKAIGRVVSAPATWKWHPVAAGASSDGSMGWTVGEAVITAADGHAGPSKYLTVWKRQPGGAIRYLTDGGNGRPVAR